MLCHTCLYATIDELERITDAGCPDRCGVVFAAPMTIAMIDDSALNHKSNP